MVSMAREYVQLSTFMAPESDFQGLRALLRNQDWIFAQYVHDWTPQPPVPLCNNAANDVHMRTTTGMAVGAHTLHPVYWQGASFRCAGRMLMHELGESSAGDTWRFWRTDPAPVGLNVRPETPLEVAG